MQEHVDHIDRALSDDTFDAFERRVAEQATWLREQIDRGALDNDHPTIGLELEAYAVDGDGHIAVLDDDLLDGAPFNPELGMHNAELNTAPSRFDADGVATQRTDIAEQYRDADAYLQEHGKRLVLDAIWTLHAGESLDFLTAREEHGPYSFAQHMREAGRYYLLDAGMRQAHDGEIPFRVPGADHILPSILFECLATSIQPHLQVPDTQQFPQYYNTAARTMAPILALATNAPFLPPDMYNAVDDPVQLVRDSYHELRIPVFEQSVNPGQDYAEKKVRFPQDLETPHDAVTVVAEDNYYDPALSDWTESKDEFTAQFWEWNYKRKTFWRWVRPVIGGQPVDGACSDRSLRIEFRPLPTQPSVQDIASFQALTVGLIHGLRIADHPITDLDWAAAKEGFYDVVHNGLDAQIPWMTEDGDRTTDQDTIFPEIFDHARRGLTAQGVPDDQQDALLQPLEHRFQDGMTPSRWKKQQVLERLEDGDSLTAAIHTMQQRYIQRSREHDRFTDWY